MAVRLTNTTKSSEFVKMVVFGDSGLGKTTLIKTAPSPIIISMEKGLLSISDFDIPVLECDTIGDIWEAYDYVTSDECDWVKTIAVDSISEIAEVMLSEKKKKYKDGRKAYGDTADDMLDLLRKFRDIEGKNVYFTGKQARIEDAATGVAKYKCMLPGKTLVQQLPYLFDEILCLHVGEDEDGEYRYVQTQPSITHDSKDRSGKLDNPEVPDLTVIFSKITGKDYEEETASANG